MTTKPGLSDAILAELQQVWLQFPQIEQVKLYGSRAKGNFTARSDIDLAIFGQNINRHTLAAIALTLDDSNIPNMVDIHLYSDIKNPLLRDHIDRVGISLYQKKPGSAEPLSHN